MHIVCTMHSSLCMHSTVSCITCMHFQCVKEKHCTLIVFHNKIFPKNWGGGPNALLAPPIRSLGGGGPWPPWPPPVADPMLYAYSMGKCTITVCTVHRMFKYTRTVCAKYCTLSVNQSKY